MGFSADWLALRDPADQAARDPALLARAAQAAGPAPVILDLGCGTGASWAALAPHLPATARWVLVDNDPALLRIAAARIGPAAQCVQLDLTQLDRLPLAGVTLVTASALLDLVSESWVRGLAQRLSVPFYAALSYDGHMRWTPSHPDDAAVTQAFNADQRRDKGFGPALGPQAAERAAAVFAALGFDTAQAPSPWMLEPAAARLQAELTDGIAQAAHAAGCAQALDWGRHRRDSAPSGSAVIGHIDLLAFPKKRA
jgi:SAM-dependent methyltransferase